MLQWLDSHIFGGVLPFRDRRQLLALPFGGLMRSPAPLATTASSPSASSTFFNFLGADIGIDIGLDWSQFQTFLFKQPMACTVLAPHVVGHIVLKPDVYFWLKEIHPDLMSSCSLFLGEHWQGHDGAGQLLPLQELQHCLNEKKPLLGSGLTGVITGGMSRWLTNTMLNCLLSCCCR